MSEQSDETAPIAPDVRDGDTPQNGAEGQGLPRRPGLRQRLYGVRSVAAVAVAGLIIGGGAGAAIHAATADGGARDGRPGFGRGPGGGQMQQMPGQGQGQGQLPGQGPGGQVPGQGAGPGGAPQLPQPPQATTPPDDSVAPDSSADTTSGNNT